MKRSRKQLKFIEQGTEIFKHPDYPFSNMSSMLLVGQIRSRKQMTR
jgi:hypothetical protein